jgi:hypothetical protein
MIGISHHLGRERKMLAPRDFPGEACGSGGLELTGLIVGLHRPDPN